MNWRTLLPAACLMLWATLTTYGQSSTPVDSESPICFSAQEWSELQAEVEAILSQTAEEAVKTAVVPLRAQIAGLEVERDEYRTAYDRSSERVAELERECALWKAGVYALLGALGVTAIGLLIAVLI